MQDVNSISLNALRIFLIVARNLSIKKTAEELLVTSGAVSHQIKALELSIGTQLLVRRNNAVELTDTGVQLAQQSAPGMRIINTALLAAIHDTNMLRVRASMSFAVRWLIPKLNLFKAKNPNANVQVETFFDDDRRSSEVADVTIRYCRHDTCPEGASILFEDICRPYLSPELLSKFTGPEMFRLIPALQCSKGNWDWQLWSAETGRPGTQFNFAERFDLDDAALRAACAGMGMILSSRFMVEDELSDGRLVALPGGEEVSLGYYTLQSSGYETGLSQRFVKWLHDISET
ncbi:MAG: LysR family transcriptional regulator [Pseudomonadota bacterium]